MANTSHPFVSSGSYLNIETEEEKLIKVQQLAAESLARVKKFKELQKYSLSDIPGGVIDLNAPPLSKVYCG